MRKLIFYILLAVAGMAMGYGCGGAAMPSTPTDVPTTVEYNAGDAVVTGSLSGLDGSINMVREATLDTSSLISAVYATNVGYTIATATIVGNCFFVTLPVGETYPLVFEYGDSLFAYYMDSTGDYNTIPLTLVDGSPSAGSFDVYDTACDITSADLPAGTPLVNVGEISIVADTADIAPRSALNIKSGRGTTSIGEQTNSRCDTDYPCYCPYQTNMASDYTGVVEGQTLRDCFYKMNVTTSFTTSEKLDNIVGADYANPANATYDTWRLGVYSTCSGASDWGTEAQGTAEVFIKMPMAVTVGGIDYPAGTEIPAEDKAVSGIGVSFSFFGHTTITSPSLPADGTYYMIVRDGGAGQPVTATITFSGYKTPTIDIDNMQCIPFLSFKFQRDGDEKLTAVDYKWMIKETAGGSWEMMSPSYVKLMNQYDWGRDVARFTDFTRFAVGTSGQPATWFNAYLGNNVSASAGDSYPITLTDQREDPNDPGYYLLYQLYAPVPWNALSVYGESSYEVHLYTGQSISISGWDSP